MALSTVCAPLRVTFQRGASLVVVMLLIFVPTLVYLGAPKAHALSTAIESTGPLATITISDDLNCDVRHIQDSLPAFFGGNACGTFVAVDGSLYGPKEIPAGGSVASRTPFTPVEQSSVTGDGTGAHPFTLVTRVALGTTGIEITQTDTYVVGQDEYSTTVEVSNPTGSQITPIVYRAADCYLANSDQGYGALTPGQSAACLDQTRQRILQWSDVSSANHPVTVYQAGYSSVWAAIATQTLFEDTCRCDSFIDNGAGISVELNVASSASTKWKSKVAFTPSHAGDRDGDGLPDDWETSGVDVGGEHVDLPGMGANPDVKDVFLQVNWMSDHYSCDVRLNWSLEFLKCVERHETFGPTRKQLGEVVEIFKDHNINLHIDAGSLYPMKATGEPWPFPRGGMTYPFKRSFITENSVQLLREAIDRGRHVGAARDAVFRQVVFGSLPWPGAGTSGVGIQNGESFFVAMSNIDGDAQVVGTIVHELGHTLGLGHGGPDQYAGSDANCKPEYRSAMNYLYQFGSTNYEESSSIGNPAPTAGQIKPCIDSGTEGIVSGSYDVHADWPDLRFDAGLIGGLSLGSLAPQSLAEEASVEDLEAAGLGGADGDGGISLAPPTLLFEGARNQHLVVEVRNVSNVPADYDVRLTVGDAEVIGSIQVPEHATRSLSLLVPDAVAIPGDVSSEAILFRKGQSEVISSVSLNIPVLPNNPEEAANAQTLLAAADLPADIRLYLEGILGQIEGGTATPTTTKPPTVTPTNTTTPTTTKPTSSEYEARDLYEEPGFHHVNGRHWYTSCEAYSQTTRCRTEIWATQIRYENGKFIKKNGWTFNNLTYLPMMKRQQWADNPLGHDGHWTATDGRKWRTECDTAVTGHNGCRSYVWASHISSSQNQDGTWRHSHTQGWLFNNLVRFKA